MLFVLVFMLQVGFVGVFFGVANIAHSQILVA
jgi:hypothetical protein